MSFSRAFKYPFHNSAKVISIVLVMTIAFVICIALVANSADWSPFLQSVYDDPTHTDFAHEESVGAGMLLGGLGLLVIIVFGGFWINGYSVAVVGEVIEGNDTMPAIEFGKNLRQGFALFLSGLAYILANILIMFALFVVISIAAKLGGLISVPVSLAGFIAAFAFAALSGWAYFIGMARYAVEDNRAPLFEIVRNIKVARKNARRGIGLALYFIALTIIYGIARTTVDSLLGGLVGADIVVAAAISVSVYFFFNLFQHFSTQHLIAQYAMAVDIGQGDDIYKFKSDDVA